MAVLLHRQPFSLYMHSYHRDGRLLGFQGIELLDVSPFEGVFLPPQAAAQSGSGRLYEKSLATSVESLGLALRLLAQLSEQEPLAALQVIFSPPPPAPNPSTYEMD